MNEKRFKNLIEIASLVDNNDKDVSAVLDREDLLELKDLIKTNFRLVSEREDALCNCIEYDKTLNKALAFIKDNAIKSDEWEEINSRMIPVDMRPIGKIAYKTLSAKKVKELDEILKGE